MKVLMFGWEFPPHITGGLGTACYGITKGLATHGVNVLFVVPKAYGDEDQSVVRILNAEDVLVEQQKYDLEKFLKHITFLKVGVTLIPYISPEEYFARITKALPHDVLFEKKFQGKLKFTGKYGPDLYYEVGQYALVAAVLATQYEFDIIHAHDWLTYPAGIAAKEISGKPLVVHVHATEFDRSGEHVNQAVYDIERKGMETADRVITVSNFTRNIVINRYGIPPDKVVTVHNAIDPIRLDKEYEFKKGVDEKIVSFLGRVTFQKGPDYFVEAANRVLQKYDNVRFVMAGSGDMLNRMIRRAAQLGITTKFHFTGFLYGDDIIHLLSLSDAYVMPSVSEPFGLTPLEAIRSNVPCIISKQSGVAEVLKYAIKVNFWDIDAIADAIYGLLNYDALANMFRKYAKDEVDKLRWDNAAFKIKKIYESLIYNIELLKEE